MAMSSTRWTADAGPASRLASWLSLPSVLSFLLQPSASPSAGSAPPPPVRSHAQPVSTSASSLSFTQYSLPASPPSFLPPARLRAELQTVDSGSHRVLSVSVGEPPQLLRLLLDTGSADLLLLNASYCQRNPSSARSCFEPQLPSTQVEPAAFSLVPYIDDGELLQDADAHAGNAVVNLPLQLIGSANLTILMGAADLTLQDSLLGYPAPSTAAVSFILSSPAADFIPPIPEPLFPFAITAYNSLTEADGILGLGYAQLSQLVAISPAYDDAFLQMTQALQTQPLAATFALDFQSNLAYLGGIEDSYRERLVWSYPASVSLAGYHSFALFDLSVCGVNLQRAVFGASEQPVSAVLDTGSSCLSLPAELFDALVTWLPVACSDSADGLQQGDSSAGSLDSVLGGNVFPPVTESGQFASSPTSAANPASASNINTHVRYCWLPADLLADALPSVSFRLSASDPQLPDSEPSQPVRLILPLTDLVVGQQRTAFTAQTPPQSVSPPYISIGSRSLSSLHVVLSMPSQQVGLANFASVSGSNASCVLPVSCQGQQQQDALYNLCVDPACSSFYFFTLNTATHSCELTAAFHVIAALLIALLIAVELGLNEWLISISSRVQGITSAQQQPAGLRSARRQQQQQQHAR